jgi:hypothetical protein
MHELDASHNATIKLNIKKYRNQKKQKHMALGFQNKRVGHLISRNLGNRTKPHLSSVDPIEVNEVSDPKIEYFLAEEDPDRQRSDHDQMDDFVNNIPPSLKGND